MSERIYNPNDYVIAYKTLCEQYLEVNCLCSVIYLDIPAFKYSIESLNIHIYLVQKVIVTNDASNA